MLGTPFYFTSVRRPIDHLKSIFNYFGMREKLGGYPINQMNKQSNPRVHETGSLQTVPNRAFAAIPDSFPDFAIEYIKNHDKYEIAGNRRGYHIANG